MVRNTALSVLAAALLAIAVAPANAEGPPNDMKAKQQDRESKREQMKIDMRQMEDRQRKEQRDLEDRHDNERKAMRDKHMKERESVRQKLQPR
ncbi:MAG: hypothetical protein K9J74_10010 [Sulfuritalea sp.]|nr:hypothetical protein [Sulfuritalea sp.]